MRQRFLLLVAVALGFVLLLPAPVAAAEWCDTDPLVLIRTPGGTLVPVYVTNGALGLEHQQAVLLANMSYTVDALGSSGTTRVRLTVLIANDLFGSAFATRSVASSGPLATEVIYARADGVSGQAMVLTFTLAVP